MGASLHIQPPISAKEIIRLAPGALLSGWEPVTPKGIAIDEAHNVFHAGRVNDALVLDTRSILLATDSGGVWLTVPGGGAPLPLSNTWTQPDIFCLGLGSRGRHHVYAGGYDGALYETQTQSLRIVSRFLNSNSARGIAATLHLQAPISIRKILRSTEAPLFDWAPVTIVDQKNVAVVTGPIRQIIVVSGLQPAKLVLATDNGVFWSDIKDGQPYAFVPAGGIKTRCMGLALGLNNSVVASPTGDVATPNLTGIYVGDWQSGKLEMKRATHKGDIDFIQWRDAVVASCAGDLFRLYAAVENSGIATRRLRQAAAKAGDSESPVSVLRLAQRLAMSLPLSLSALIEKIIPPPWVESVYAVLISSDGGATWSPCGPKGRVAESVHFNGAGGQNPGQSQSKGGAAYNMSIAVSPTDVDTIALGWRRGPWIGTNGLTAFTWAEHGDDGSPGGANAALHSDIHGLHFDPQDSQGQTLYVCSDGGFAFTRDLCATFDSSINARLPNLQFQSTPARGTGTGPSDVSVVAPGLCAGALQDNGVVFSFVASDGTQRPWQRHSGDEDGQLAIFLTNNLLLAWTNSDPNSKLFHTPRARVARWTGDHFDPANFVNGSFVTIRTPSPTAGQDDFLFARTFDDKNPFDHFVAEHVAHPAFENPVTKQQMCAIAANGSQGPGELWGLFADSDGSNPFWDFLAAVRLEVDEKTLAVDEKISAVGCDNGFTVLVGTNKGNIYALDVPTKKVVAKGSFKGGSILQFSFMSDGAAVARLASSLVLFDGARLVGQTIATNGLPIEDEGGLYFMAVDNTTSPDTIYVATDCGVHASWDFGANWLPVSQGLPVRAHPSTLRFVEEPSGNRMLYLFTYGRSAWRARLI